LTFISNQITVLSLPNGPRAQGVVVMMFRHILTVLSLSLTLTFGIVRFANTNPGGNHGWGNSAPELDPTASASGLAILAGGILLLAERRRRKVTPG
jgi:hypothetical protein